MTRVLHLIKGLGPGGAERLLVNQARATSAADLDVSVAYLVPWKDALVSELADAGWPATCLGSGRAWDLRWALRLRRLLTDGRVDVVHGHSPLVAAISRLVLRTISADERPASLYTEHNEWGRHHRLTRLLNRLTIGLEDRVVAVSQGVRRSMPASIDAEVVIHGIDVEAVAAQQVHRSAVRAELGVGDDEIVIGTVANLRREKAYDILLEAAAIAVRERPDLRFVAIGQGPLDAEIASVHARLGLGDRFSLLGYRADATRVMSAFDVFTLASRHEGLPVSLMEAAALGLPVVATAAGGVPEALSGSGAVVVPPGAVAALAAAYVACDATAGQRQFSARASSDRLAELYSELASRRQRPGSGAPSTRRSGPSPDSSSASR